MDGVATPEERVTEDDEEKTQDTTVEVSTNGVEGPDSQSENKFQKAIAAWRSQSEVYMYLSVANSLTAINLTDLVPTLDSTAADLVTHQRDALVERKDLAQKTKEFRRLDEEVKLTEIKTLLKGIQPFRLMLELQTDDEQLTKHTSISSANQSKIVSSSFLQVYSSLSEAPDPYPLLEASVDALVATDQTVPKLESENKQLQANNQRLTGQLEEAERRLESEREARQTLTDVGGTRIKEVEASWSAVLAEKEDNWRARERSLEERAENSDRLLKELKANYEVSRRLEQSDGDGTSQGASSAELELLNSDLERANSRLAEVQARNENLRLEIAQASTHKEQKANVEDDPSFQRLRSENSSLLRKADAARLERDMERRNWDSKAKNLQNELAVLREDSKQLKTKVEKWADYDEVKRELDIIKAIEFSTEDGDDLQGDAQNMDGSTTAGGQKSGNQLEQLLLARNKKLNDELTVVRVSHQDLTKRLETLQEDMSSTNMELERARNLNATLENDLARMQDDAVSTHPAMSVAPSRYPSTAYGGRRNRTSPTSSIISGIDGPGTPENLRQGETYGGGSGILPMITAQRDRFKKRISELESELSKQYGIVSSLRSEVASLQKDNLNLYERTRYVSSYSQAPMSSASAYAPSPTSTTIQMGEPTGVDRYRSAYESNLSPFAAFRGRESARALRRMTLPERVFFQLTRMVLATRTSRNLFGLYCLGLHLLIFCMLYYMSTMEIDKHVAHLGDAAAANVFAAADGLGSDDFHVENQP